MREVELNEIVIQVYVCCSEMISQNINNERASLVPRPVFEQAWRRGYERANSSDLNTPVRLEHTH